ncbi:MAG TPA: redoxin domain-containing protein, partial [Thermoguttaceae bacterium]|nr:redoxin domain-containing protein [Thermoguttaceae bacterium]
VKQRIERVGTSFATLMSSQKAVTSGTKWVQFSGSQPGIVPTGTAGSTKDLRVWENVTAIVQDGETHGQLQIGTLVQVGDVWRLIDVPQIESSDQAELADSGFFFRGSAVDRPGATQTGPSETDQKLLADLEQLDREAAQATTPEQQAQFNARRTDLLEAIVKQAGSAEERAMWVRQLADMVSASVQSGTFPEGTKRLEALFEQLSGSPADKDLAAYVKFRHMTAAYGSSLQAPDADFTKIQEQWLKDLEQYVTDYPATADAAEAMLQLAIAKEFAGQEEDAKQWYGRIVTAFPGSPAAEKAAGARTRLDSVGKTIALQGKSATGGVVDLSKYRGKVVLIQYWATWCEPAKADMAALKELLTKYGRSMSVIGVNLDNSPKALSDFLATNRLPWPQIFEAGGLDSRPANQLGILTLPTMILVDEQGKVVNRNIQIAELDPALKKLIR